jgi:2-polyprenyl-3-methyl-5-hydroxy-6-metoxy-1,4-benzoquinol methylase
MGNPAEHRELDRYVQAISASSKLQARSLARWLAVADDRYFELADDVCARLTQHVFAGDHERGVRAYLALCQEINREQFHFKKTGAYRTRAAQQAFEEVYSNETRMREYIVGLLLSYLFWPGHYRMLAFFQEHVRRLRPGSVCEVGVGHALFTREVLRAAPVARATVVDLSATSLAVARETLAAFGADAARIDFRLGDFMAEAMRLEPADLLVFGDVIEHVDEPVRFLAHARRHLTASGRLYLSTCANCPAPDHVHLFRSVAEIRDVIAAAGFTVEDELVLPLEEHVPPELWAEKRVNLNYAAILRAS